MNGPEGMWAKEEERGEGTMHNSQGSRLKAQDSRLKTQDSRLKTQDSRLKTQDSKRQHLARTTDPYLTVKPVDESLNCPTNFRPLTLQPQEFFFFDVSEAVRQMEIILNFGKRSLSLKNKPPEVLKALPSRPFSDVGSYRHRGGPNLRYQAKPLFRRKQFPCQPVDLDHIVVGLLPGNDLPEVPRHGSLPLPSPRGRHP